MLAEQLQRLTSLSHPWGSQCCPFHGVYFNFGYINQNQHPCPALFKALSTFPHQQQKRHKHPWGSCNSSFTRGRVRCEQVKIPTMYNWLSGVEKDGTVQKIINQRKYAVLLTEVKNAQKQINARTIQARLIKEENQAGNKTLVRHLETLILFHIVVTW